MCHTANIWSAALLLLFFLTRWRSMRCSRCASSSSSERRYPAQWEEWVDEDAWGDESSATYSAGFWYVLSGKYRSLGDPQLTARAVGTRLAAIVSIVAFASWGVFIAITHASPGFACLLGSTA